MKPRCPTPLEVSRDPEAFLREVRGRIQKRYGHVSGASRLRAATRDVWLLAEALAFVHRERSVDKLRAVALARVQVRRAA